MFRALAIIIMLSGNPNLNATPAGSVSYISVSQTDVNNFQVMENQEEFDITNISAKSVLAIDLDSQVTLYKHNIQEQLPIASLAKLMTALVILEEHDLNEIVTISDEVNQVIGSRIWLYKGEQITVENLLKGMLIKSGNDAAYELAKFNAGSLEEFAKKMNKKAELLGLKNSHFLDPAGLDDVNNYSTTKDLALISTHILKNDFVRNIVSIRETSIFSVNGKLEHRLKNTNKLLGSSMGAKGLKTGTTDKAGQCLITLVEVNGNDILIILLGSENRFEDTKVVYNYLESS